MNNMTHRIRKPTTCMGENKVADQLCSYTHSTISILFKSEFSNPFMSDRVGNSDSTVGFLMRRLKSFKAHPNSSTEINHPSIQATQAGIKIGPL